MAEPDKGGVPHLHVAGTHPGKDKAGNHKPAGIPLWGWGVGVLAIIVLVAWYRRRAAAVTGALPVDASGTYTTTDNGAAGDGTLNASPSYFAGDSTLPTQTYSNNAQWLAAALTHMGGTGADPIHALAALNRFLSGQDLSYTDQAVVNAAVSAIGLPPSFAYGSGVGTLAPKPAAPPKTSTGTPVKPTPKPAPKPAPKPKPKPAPKPAPKPKPPVKPPVKPTPKPPVKKPAPHPAPKPAPAATKYVVIPGDSLSKIAQHFYHNAGEWPRIYNANKGVIGSNPNKIHPGMVLTIPH